jgi:uncharacterized membrane protein YcaP (DUF421 family)
MNMLVALLSSRSRKLAAVLDGTPVLLGRDGQFFDSVIKRCRITESDIEQALREADCPRHEMRCAFLEADGKITIQTRT